MNIAIKKSHLGILILATMLISALLFAVAVFAPSTQPTVTMGQYALANNDLTDGDTRAYRPWFENRNWQGDVIEYEILAADGSRRTDVDIGATPATQGNLGYCNRSASGCWSARAGFEEAEAADSSYWQQRNIFTKNTDSKQQTEFLWPNLSDIQKSELDPETVSYIAASADPSSLNTDYISEILNYIRGERVHERSNLAPGVTDAYFRTRYSLLGDVTVSPVYIGPPKELLSRVNGFADFATAQANRLPRIAVPANDGMLHILDADNGREVYAYVPSMVLPKLSALAAKYETYQHTHYLAGELALGSAQISDGDTSPKPWHTILAGGGGPGFPGLFALDVTDPFYPGTAGDKLLFEKTLADDGFGYIYGKPQIAPLGTDNANPNWYIITGNGYSTSSGFPTALKFVSLDDGSTVAATIDPTLSTGGLSAPTLLSIDGDDIPDLAFAGDTKGDLWMFEIDQSDPANSSYTKIFDGNINQPISNAPVVAKHPTEEGYMVYFGTGSIFSLDDALNDGAYPGTESYILNQNIYGIWVDTSDLTTLETNLGTTGYNSTMLVEQTLAQTSKQFYSGGPTQSVRITPTEHAVDYRCPFDAVDCDPATDTYKGWTVKLPNCGERMIATPIVRAGRIQFVTTNPTGLRCGERTFAGDSWVMSLDYLTGADGNNTVVYNLNNDSSLSDGDTVPYTTATGDSVNKAPVGLGLGQGNISQPTFARLRFGTDKMFINGLILPLPPISNPGDLLGGHIDVETDSPTNGVIATNNRDKHSEGYNIQTSDGLGGAVDGHVHDYDGIHDKDFVDLFRLEPRRGKVNLVDALADPPVNGACSTTENEKGILVNGSCLQAVEGELNRAYDVLHTDADGKLDPLKGPVNAIGLPSPIHQSEVNSLNDPTAEAFTKDVPDTKFIVVLANADLSTGGTLQIGCRYWPVAEYQKMITPQLLAGKSPGDLDDTYHGGTDDLVFTLAGIVNDGDGNCADINDDLVNTNGLSKTPTLRVGFGQRTLYDEGIIATRAQCVLGLHRPNDKICYTDQDILSGAEESLKAGAPDIFYVPPSNSCSPFTASKTPPAIYIRDPAWNLHITPENSTLPDGTTVTTYRWRNGALTVQLLKAYNEDGSVGYTLQTHDLTPGSGIIAQAFTPEATPGTQKDINGDPVLNGSGDPATITITTFKSSKTANESGMLYEANIFFHYSALNDGIRNDDPNNTTPPDGGCYGGSGYSGHSSIDIGGLNPSDYKSYVQPLKAQCDDWTDESKPCPLEQYANFLQTIEKPDSEQTLNQALLDLSKLLAENALLAEYVKYRQYVSPKFNYGKDLLDIDRGQLDSGTGETPTNGDGTPTDVETIETIDLEAKGPNYYYGRRNWVDIGP